MNRGSRKVEKGVYRGYLKKADDFYRGMKVAFEGSNWNSVGLEAVHCVISANDALLAYYGGVRSVSRDHKDAARFLLDTIDTEEAGKKAKHLRAVIAKKNLVEYENRSFIQSEAEEIYRHTERFYLWVRSMLPEER
ncbi:MAG: HEPN domain-containing protein [Thermodesulfobacteriota bacterium]